MVEQVGNSTLYLGDYLDILPGITGVDAVVTDPPYGLGFMGKDWDHSVPGEKYWRNISDACKPGAHLLAFGGTRTFHRLVCAIEDAGWEIRDTIMWVYGSGFPKSMNISRPLIRRRGSSRLILGNPRIGANQSGDREKFGSMEVRGKNAGRVTAPATEAAKQWEGWGTALKPAWEPIIVARKPFTGTVAANVLEHGTGGLNIDGCRVPLANETPPQGSAKRVFANNQFAKAKKYGDNKTTPAMGRFPANLIHDGSEEVVGLFPQTFSGAMDSMAKGGNFNVWSKQTPRRVTSSASSGSAARFFYCAKASKADRGEGNTQPTVKPVNLMRYLCRLITPPGGIILDPFMGSGSTGKAAILEGFKFVGIEKGLEAYNVARDRLAKIKPQLALNL